MRTHKESQRLLILNDALLNDALGKNINIGNYVVYYKRGAEGIQRALDSDIKKYVWRVDGFGVKGVKLVNIINNESFTTKENELVNLRVLKRLGMITEDYISFKTYHKLKSMLSTDLDNYPWDTRSWIGPKAFEHKAAIEKKMRAELDRDILNEFDNSEEEETSIMKSVKTNNIVPSAVDATKVAARITAGKAMNRVVREKVTPMLPRMVSGYADTQVGEVVIANMFQFIVDNFAVNNDKAQLAAQVMNEAAMVDFLATFNFDQMLADVLGSVSLDAITEDAKATVTAVS